jgi:hypothetical protein
MLGRALAWELGIGNAAVRAGREPRLRSGLEAGRDPLDGAGRVRATGTPLHRLRVTAAPAQAAADQLVEAQPAP